MMSSNIFSSISKDGTATTKEDISEIRPQPGSLGVDSIAAALGAVSGSATPTSTKSNLYDVAIGAHQIPIIYRPEYNITLFGLERLHPFDSGKWGRVIQLLKQQHLLVDDSLIQPHKAAKSDLLRVHKQRYLNSLKWSVNVAQITEVTGVALLPNCLLQKKLLRPFRYQTGGSVLAGRCAVERGWSINMGGGFHHCSAGRGGGFCAYADITLTVTVAMEHYDHINRVLIVDLDAHQGNGHERDFMGRSDVYILDVYNRLIYPRDENAKQAISKRVELSPYTEDRRYLQAVEIALQQSLEEFPADLVVYNAGTDVLEEDPLGLLSITKQGVIRRDELVWRAVRSRGVPLVMLTSGGYQRITAAVIADSIANLHDKALIDLKPTTLVTASSASATAAEQQYHEDSGGGGGGGDVGVVMQGDDLMAAVNGKRDECESMMSPKRKDSTSSAINFKYPSFLSRCTGKKKSSTVSGGVSASESSTPLSGRHSVTDSTTSSPPPAHSNTLLHQEGVLVQPGIKESLSALEEVGNHQQEVCLSSEEQEQQQVQLQQQQPPSFINIKPLSHFRQSIVSPDSADYGTPHSTAPPLTSLLDTPTSGGSVGGNSGSGTLHPAMTQQTSMTDSLTPPSPAYRSVAGSVHTVNTAGAGYTPPLQHKSIDSTLSLDHHSGNTPAGSITTPPSHYESADSINMAESLPSSVFVPP